MCALWCEPLARCDDVWLLSAAVLLAAALQPEPVATVLRADMSPSVLRGLMLAKLIHRALTSPMMEFVLGILTGAFLTALFLPRWY